MEMLFVFSKVPIAPLLEDGDTGLGLKELFRMKIFLDFVDYDDMCRSK